MGTSTRVALQLLASGLLVRTGRGNFDGQIASRMGKGFAGRRLVLMLNAACSQNMH